MEHRWRSRVLVWAAIVGLPWLGACRTLDDDGVPEGRRDPVTPLERGGEPRAAPSALRRAFLSARMAEARPEHHFGNDEPGVFEAVHPSQGLRFVLDEEGLAITPARGGPWGARLRLAGLGRHEASRAVRPVRPTGGGNRVEYARDGITEWYVHGPLGLEQGFVVTERPPGDGPLAIDVAVSGLDARPWGDGAVLLGGGDARLFYTNLFASDADARPLPSRMEVSPRSVRLVVDDRDASYPVTVDPLYWVEEAELVGSAADASTRFGGAVAVEGDTAVIGTYDWTTAGEAVAYVFVRVGRTWTEQQILTPSVAEDFGHAVAISGESIVVGGPEANGGDGAVYVFTRAGGIWTEQQRIVRSDSVAGETSGFGRAVAISVDTLAATAPSGAEAVYVLTRSSGVWTDQQRLSTPDLTGIAGCVAVQGDTLVAGAGNADDHAGAAYVFVRSGDLWTEQQRLTESATSVYFGRSVALSGETVAIGSPGDLDSSGGFNRGSVYVFTRSAGVWTEEGRLVASDGAGGSDPWNSGDWFGESVAIDGDELVAGAYGDDLGAGWGAGSAYVFTRSGAVWTERRRLTAADASTGDHFGMAVATAGDTTVVGAHRHDPPGAADWGTGAAYVFLGRLEQGDACVADGDCHSEHCVDGVCCDAPCGGGSPTDCQACSLGAGGTSDGACGPLAAATAPTVTCRPSTGLCDPPERCTTSSVSCPADELAAAGTECRASTSDCDAPELCSGSAASCPDDDPHALDGESCEDGLDWSVGDACDGGTCIGTEVGSCDEPYAVGAIPYAHSSTLSGRPSHLSSYGAGCGASDLSGADVAYELEATAGEAYEVTAGGVGLDTAIAVLAACAEPGDCLAFADDGGSGEAESVTFVPDSGGTYVVVVEAVAGSGGYDVSVTAAGSDGDGDVDADVDADVDTDADVDADADADAGSDGDADADGDLEADADEDGGSETDADGDAGEGGDGCSCRAGGARPRGSAGLLLLALSCPLWTRLRRR